MTNGSTDSGPDQQACAVAYRLTEQQIEFCLVTSRKGKRWVLPKGFIDPGETLEEAALKEAFEEAGVRGRVVGEPLGSYEYRKWGRALSVTVVLLEVDHVADQWLEAETRQRCWLPFSPAHEKLGRDEQRPFLVAAHQRLDEAD